MSVKSCENLEKSQVKLTIEVGAEEFEKAVNKAYLQMRGKMNVPGFRPGKAPRKIIEGMYGAEVFYEEAVNIVLPDAYEAAVQEQKLEVVGYPQVELESCGKDGVVFQCTVAVYPEVTLGGLVQKGLFFLGHGVVLLFFLSHGLHTTRPEDRQKETTSSLGFSQGAMAVTYSTGPSP